MFDTQQSKSLLITELALTIVAAASIVAVTAPKIVANVENAKMKKDNVSMEEIVDALEASLIDVNVYSEVMQYSVKNNFSEYDIKEDGTPGIPSGEMKGITITFSSEIIGDKPVVVLNNGVINEMPNTENSGVRFLDKNYKDSLDVPYTVKNMSGTLQDSALSQYLESRIGPTIELASKSYENSSYTVFISISGSGTDKMVSTYGLWNGVNLAE